MSPAALEITGSESLAGVPLALRVVGSSATAIPVSAVSGRIGRRAGLTAALTIAVAGAAGVVAAGVLESFARSARPASPSGPAPPR